MRHTIAAVAVAAVVSLAAPVAFAGLEEAEDALTNEDYAQALSLYREAAKTAKKKKRKVDQQAALEGAVQAAFNLGDFATAYEAQKEVVALIPARRDKIPEAQLQAGVLAVYAGKFDEAHRSLDAAEKAFAKSGSKPLQAKAHLYKGIAFQRQTKYEETIKSFTRSRELSIAAGEPREAARRLLDAANVQKEMLFDFPRAMALYDAAAAELEAAGDAAGRRETEIDKANLLLVSGKGEDAIGMIERVRQAVVKEEPAGLKVWIRATQILANAHFRTGSFDEAAAFADLVLAEAPKLASEAARVPHVIDATNLKGLLAAETGRTDDAMKLFGSALATAESAKLKAKQSIVLNNMGYWLREAGRFDEAVKRLEQALAIDKGLKATDGIAYDQRNLGFALLESGKTAQAKPLLTEAFETSRKLGSQHNAAASEVGVGLAALAGGDAKTAETHLRQALERATDSFLIDWEWRARSGLAAALVKQGKVDGDDGALAVYATAVETIETLEDALGSDAARAGFKGRASVRAVFTAFEAALRAKGLAREADQIKSRAKPRTVPRLQKT